MSDVYVRVRPMGTVFETRELVEGELMADFGPDGELIGVEVLGSIGVKIDGHTAHAVANYPRLPHKPLPFPEDEE
jgi:uncharacterized protein YuzE